MLKVDGLSLEGLTDWLSGLRLWKLRKLLMHQILGRCSTNFEDQIALFSHHDSSAFRRGQSPGTLQSCALLSRGASKMVPNGCVSFL